MGDARLASVSLVGDLMLRSPLAEGATDNGALGEVVATLRETGRAIANLEMPLSRRGSKVFKHATLRSDPERIADVHALGFDAVSLANNHMLDYGPLALLDTVDTCREAGILHAGAGADLKEALAPAYLGAGGKRIALLSVASTLPPGFEATETTPGIAPIRVFFSLEIDANLLSEQPGTVPVVHTWTRVEDQESVCALVRRLAGATDLVVVAIHWGVPTYWMSPYTGLLAEYQQPLGRALIDAGADVVFGHHPHLLHGIEVYRDRPIFYSAGNFLFERPRAFMQPESVIAQVEFGERLSVALVPLTVDERGFPRLATGLEAEQVRTRLTILSAPFETGFEREGERLLLALG